MKKTLLLLMVMLSLAFWLGCEDSHQNQIETMILWENSKKEMEALNEKLRESDAGIQFIKEYSHNLDIEVMEARYINTDNDCVPGLKFKVTNNGDKSISGLQIKVLFKDANDIVIGEQDFILVSKKSTLSNWGHILKPKYSLCYPVAFKFSKTT